MHRQREISKKSIAIVLLFAVCMAGAAYYDDFITIKAGGDVGSSRIIPKVAAIHANSIKQAIEECKDTPIREFTFPEISNQKELDLVNDVLMAIFLHESKQDVIEELRASMNQDMEFVWAGIDGICDIPVLREALVEDVASLFALPTSNGVLNTKHIIKRFQQLNDASPLDLTALERKGLERLLVIVKGCEVDAKNRYLEAKVPKEGLFFTGISMGELLLSLKKHYSDREDCLGLPASVFGHHINSIEGLKCIGTPYRNLSLEQSCVLSIYDTSIEYLPAHSFQHARCLTSLIIENNPLVQVDEKAFEGLEALQKLTLCDNKRLTHLPIGLFDSLQSLERLDLSGNELLQCFPKMFATCKKLKELCLPRNSMALWRVQELYDMPIFRRTNIYWK